MYIALEGVDYCGKTRLLNQLCLTLKEIGEEPLVIREPGSYTQVIRDHVLEHCSDEFERAVMMLGDRILTHRQVIKPYLHLCQTRGNTPLIISDRCYLSSLVYQGVLCDDLVPIAEMHERLFASNVLVAPDHIFVIQPTTDEVIDRMRAYRKGAVLDKTETENRAIIAARQEAYHEMTAGGVYDRILGSSTPNIVEIHTQDLSEQVKFITEYLK